MPSNRFKVENRGDYIYLKTWGGMQLDGLEKPAETALAMSQETGIKNLLDNIQEVDSTVNFSVQLKGIKILWKLRKFKRVAVVLKQNELGGIFFSSISALRLDHGAIRGFGDEVEAIAWLQAGHTAHDSEASQPEKSHSKSADTTQTKARRIKIDDQSKK